MGALGSIADGQREGEETEEEEGVTTDMQASFRELFCIFNLLESLPRRRPCHPPQWQNHLQNCFRGLFAPVLEVQGCKYSSRRFVV